MVTLILTVIIGLGIAFFALQNNAGATVTLLNYQIPGVPVYLIVIVSLLIGLFVSWIISIGNAVSNVFALRGRDHALRGANRTIEDLHEQVHELEVENARLRGERKEPVVIERKADEQYRPTLWERMKASFNQRRYRQAV